MANPPKRILKPEYTTAHPGEFVKINDAGDGFDSSPGTPGDTPTLAEVLTRDSDGGGKGISNVSAISFSVPPATNFLYMYSPNGTPWIVSIANNGTLSIVNG